MPRSVSLLLLPRTPTRAHDAASGYPSSLSLRHHPINPLATIFVCLSTPTGCVAHISRPERLQCRQRLGVSEHHLICDRAPRLRQRSTRAPGGTKKTRLPAMPATLMLGRDVRGASDAGQACPVLCSRQDGRAPRCRTALRASWTVSCGSACRSGPRYGPRECLHLERYERDTIRPILCRGPPAWGGGGLTPTPAGSLAGRPAGGSGAAGTRGRGPSGG